MFGLVAPARGKRHVPQVVQRSAVQSSHGRSSPFQACNRAPCRAKGPAANRAFIPHGPGRQVDENRARIPNGIADVSCNLVLLHGRGAG